MSVASRGSLAHLSDSLVGRVDVDGIMGDPGRALDRARKALFYGKSFCTGFARQRKKRRGEASSPLSRKKPGISVCRRVISASLSP
ncbi:hypothetical protein SCFA_1260002 [anaerobic digester metagenome]|uniref:Uncharacterized protein n=1 Tax=anaerobic digester metagenome TaxID=1263854 RepID=A0A485LW10_9ZZZZ